MECAKRECNPLLRHQKWIDGLYHYSYSPLGVLSILLVDELPLPGRDVGVASLLLELSAGVQRLLLGLLRRLLGKHLPLPHGDLPAQRVHCGYLATQELTGFILTINLFTFFKKFSPVN